MRVSFILPCLNESSNLAYCIGEVRKALLSFTDDYEIIVVDNGSSDNSVEIAENLSCKVVHETKKGYGAAIMAGVAAMREGSSYLIFADSDGTYCYEDAGRLFRETLAADQSLLGLGQSLGIAVRDTDNLQSQSMPFLHRYIGTPILNLLLHLLYRLKLTDCNSGFRCMSKETFCKLEMKSKGMEFASEMLIRAAKKNFKIIEIKSGLRCAPQPREKHLRTWRDGMRHLLLIFSHKPQFFEIIGLFLLFFGSFFQIISYILGPLELSSFSIFYNHTKLLLIIFSMLGAQLYLIGAIQYVSLKEKPLPITKFLINLDESILLIFGFLAVALVFLIISSIVLIWANAGFANMSIESELFIFTHFAGIFISIILGLIGLNLIHNIK